MRRVVLALLLTSTILASMNASGGDIIVRFDDPDEPAKRTAAFERAASAMPIDPADGDQVRVWFFPYWSGELKATGYIVTRKGVWRCVVRYKHRAEDIAVHSGGKCSGPHRYPERIDRVMALMEDAAKPDKEKAYCEVMDGWGAEIHGIYAGSRFAFSAMNTGECTDTNPVAARVDHFLNMVSAAWLKKDED
jgi:hypothetical protein